MCGIAACQVDNEALQFLVPALRRMEYRGYDSAGVAVHAGDGSIVRLRSVGHIGFLEKTIASYNGLALNGTGIAHTRWSTHGAVTTENAHPHADCTGRVAIVHNGIIENNRELRQQLSERGHAFASAVDSEVMAHLIEEALETGADFLVAVQRCVNQLSGSWALAAFDATSGRIVLACHRSPLLIAHTASGVVAASDFTALADWCDTAQILRDGDIVELGAVPVWTSLAGPRTAPEPVAVECRNTDIELGIHPDFMSKEIAEQPGISARLLAELADGCANGELWRGLGLADFQRVRILACGTSLNAGTVIGRLLRSVGGVPVQFSVASEAGDDILEPATLTIALSQSGETADVLRALENSPSPVLAITNNPFSTLARQADAMIDCRAGVEIGVAATKTFLCQILSGLAVAISALVHHGLVGEARAQTLVDELLLLPADLIEAEELSRQYLPALAERLAAAKGLLYVARGAGLPYAAEGALKLKELSYLWAEAYPAGELKHGPIALIEAGTPVIVVDDGDPRLESNISEMAARGADVVVIGGLGADVPVAIRRQPWGPLAATVALQHLARYVAVELGRDVDRPRNLAKSVTVE